MPSPPTVVTPASDAEALAAIEKGSSVINFCATWCEPCVQLNAVFAELAEEHGAALRFVQLDADEFPDLCERFEIESVPAFLFLHSGKVTDTLIGASPGDLVGKVKENAITANIYRDEVAAANAPAPVPLNRRLASLTSRSPVMLFMKGSPDEPRCGFSRQIVELLQGEKVSFGHFDILSDEEVRQGLKTFSNWPTYPQLYVEGKLLGGLDVLKEMKEEDELKDAMPASAVAE